MEYKYLTFEEFLQNKHYEENPTILDDDLPDAYSDWLGEQDAEGMIKLGEEYGVALLEQAKKLHEDQLQHERLGIPEDDQLTRQEIQDFLDNHQCNLTKYGDDRCDCVPLRKKLLTIPIK